MRRLSAIVALVLPWLALAQNLYPTPADWRPPDYELAKPGRSATTVLSAQLSSTGPLLEESPNTVSHVWFDGRHNYALQSGTPASGTVAVSPWTVGGSITAVSGAPEGGVWGEITTTISGQYLTQSVTVPSGTSFYSSYYVQRTSGGQHSALYRCGAGNASGSCVRSDGVACAVTPSGSDLFIGGVAGATLGADPVKVDVVLACSSATTSVQWRGYGAEFNVAGTTRYTALNVSAAASAYVPTTTAARTSVPLDTIGNTWTENGGVPATQANFSPFVPGKAGAGPYSAANNYQGSTSLMEWAGDWSVTVVFKGAATGGYQVIASKYNSTNGWYCAITPTGEVRTSIYDGTAKTVNSTTQMVPNAINVATCGRSGGTMYARVNGGASNSLAGIGTMTSSATLPVRLGRYEPAGVEFVSGQVYEILASTTPYSDALHLARYRRVFGMLTQQGGAVSVTRATDETYTANGYVWSTPNDTLSTGTDGVEVWKASAPGLTAQSASCVAGVVNPPWTLAGAPTCVADQATAPNGDGMDEWTSVVNTDRVYQQATIASSTTATSSVWAQKTASGFSTVIGRCVAPATAATACACGTSDNSACALVMGGLDCVARFSAVSTTPVRAWVGTTCDVASTLHTVLLNPGNYGTSTGTTRFGMAQVEPGLYPTPYTTATRNAGVVTTPLPDLGNKWCVSVTAKAADVSSNHILWAGGATASANSIRLYQTSSSYILDVYDGAAAIRNAVSTTTPTTVATRLTACGNGTADGVRICKNGVDITTSRAGAGTALFSGPPASTLFYLGTHSGGTSIFDGALSNLKVCKGATRCGDCP